MLPFGKEHDFGGNLQLKQPPLLIVFSDHFFVLYCLTIQISALWVLVMLQSLRQVIILYPMISDNTSKHQSLLLARFYLLIVNEDVSDTFKPMKILI